jgi:hypothetical protein
VETSFGRRRKLANKKKMRMKRGRLERASGIFYDEENL